VSVYNRCPDKFGRAPPHVIHQCDPYGSTDADALYYCTIVIIIIIVGVVVIIIRFVHGDKTRRKVLHCNDIMHSTAAILQ